MRQGHAFAFTVECVYVVLLHFLHALHMQCEVLAASLHALLDAALRGLATK